MDENPGVIEPFLKEHQLAVTVIPAYSYVTETLKVNGIPQNWIVDSMASRMPVSHFSVES